MCTDVPELSLGRPSGDRPGLEVLRRLVPVLKPYSGRIGLAMAFLLLAKVAGLGVPMVLKRLIDMLGMKPSLAVVPLEQTYTALGDGRVRYVSGSFTAELTVDADGFVTHYPGLADSTAID